MRYGACLFVTHGEMLDLYVTQDLTMDQIAERFEVSARTIGRALKRLRIPIKAKRGVSPICDCGACELCKQRPYTRQYYKRNRGAIIAANAAYNRERRARQRQERARPKRRETLDAELDRMDRMAAESLGRAW
jgi:transcriptional regulator GlxA family with amidase domain